MDWEWFNEPKTLSVFIFLLLMARRTPGNWKGHAINAGEVISSRDSIAKKTGLSPAEVRTAMRKLQTTNEISVISTSKFSVITVCNYERYQTIDTSVQPTKGQPIRPPKKKPRTNGKQTISHNQDCNTDDRIEDLTNEDNPLIKSPRSKGFSMRDELLNDGLDESLVDAYMRVRKSKKAPDSVISYNGIKREADKAGISMETAITECVERNWVGFKAEWYERVRPQPTLFAQQPDRKRAEAEMEEISRRTRAEREERERKEAEAARARDKQKILDSIYKQ